MITQSFYHYVQIFRNADLLDSDQQAQFAELVFLDGDFPKSASDFETISNYTNAILTTYRHLMKFGNTMPINTKCRGKYWVNI